MGHDIVGDQGIFIVEEHDAPMEMHADFVGTSGQLAESESTITVRGAKSGTHIGNGLRGLLPHFWRQFVRRFLDPPRKENADHSLLVKAVNLPALREAAISAKAKSSAPVARANVTPYSSSAENRPDETVVPDILRWKEVR